MRVLVVAKAPVPGRVKTRLGVDVGDDHAASVAAASLLDTLEACASTVGAERCHLALDGDLADAVRGPEILSALEGWTITAQRGDDFAARLVAAHEDAGAEPVVQVGMDTPQLTPALLADAFTALVDADALLAPAHDGGWWALGRRDPGIVGPVGAVEMSAPTTYEHTRAALTDQGLTVASTAGLRDVDTVEDADAVAAVAPLTRFAAAWAAARGHLDGAQAVTP